MKRLDNVLARQKNNLMLDVLLALVLVVVLGVAAVGIGQVVANAQPDTFQAPATLVTHMTSAPAPGPAIG